MSNIKGIIFDYGGTIDTNGIHWAEVIWEQYRLAGIGIDKQLFREAYIHGESTLGRNRIIKTNDTFYTLLEKKTAIQSEYLKNHGHELTQEEQRVIVEGCYKKVTDTLKTTCNIVEKLSRTYPLVLVTNFYGNMPVVLQEFNLKKYFPTVVESSVEGIRKPDPALFAIGVKALSLASEEILVVGDSYSKDILPALTLGCKTAWIKHICWQEETPLPDAIPHFIIDSLEELPAILETV